MTVAKRYPGLKQAFVRGLFMDWPAAPWTRAGYSFPAPGQVTTVGPLLRRASQAGCISPASMRATSGLHGRGARLGRKRRARIAVRDGVAAAAP